jgi:hypothetical protein
MYRVSNSPTAQVKRKYFGTRFSHFQAFFPWHRQSLQHSVLVVSIERTAENVNSPVDNEILIYI